MRLEAFRDKERKEGRVNLLVGIFVHQDLPVAFSD